MPDTSSDYFTNVNQGGVGFIWTNPNNVKAEPGFADSNTNTGELRLDTPKAAAEIPAGQVITHIELTFLGIGDETDVTNGNFTIAGGTLKQIVLIQPPIAPQVVTGDLDFWGINQTQAQDFAAGTEDLVYTATSISTDATTCSYIRCMFTYESAPDLVAPPVLF